MTVLELQGTVCALRARFFWRVEGGVFWEVLADTFCQGYSVVISSLALTMVREICVDAIRSVNIYGLCFGQSRKSL